MGIVSFANEALTRLRAPTVIDHGSPVRDWDNAAGAVLEGWTLQPGASDEDTYRGEVVRADWTAHGPYDADVIATDKIRLPSGDYSIIGEPERWKSPTGRISSTKLLLQKWAVG